MAETKTVKKPAKKVARREPKKQREREIPPPPQPKIKISGAHDVSRNIEEIFTDGVLIDLNIGFWLARAVNTTTDLSIEEKVPDFVVGLGTKRLVPKDLYDSWVQIIAAARYAVRKDSFVFPLGETCFVPVERLPSIEARLLELQKEFLSAREYLGRHFSKIRDEYISKQPAKHRDNLRAIYPSQEEACSRFYFSWTVFNATLPKKTQLAAFNRKKAAEGEKALARYRHELEQRMQRFLADAATTMRAKVIDACHTITENVKAGKVVTDRSLTALRDLIDRFKEMNFVGDAEIERRLESLKKDVLRDRDAETFASDAKLQETLLSSLNDLTKTAAAVTDLSDITGGYRRRIRVD